MAQGVVVSLPNGLPVNGIGADPTSPAALTAEEIRQIREYERIVRFKDEVLAGTHPRVKIPAHLVGKQPNPTHNVSSPSLSAPRSNVVVQPSRSTPTTHNDESATTVYNRSPNAQRTSAMSHIPMSSNSEINPILLEKSDDLIKAEIQLQRVRLERGLREQIEQQRIATKALLQTSESLPNFDLSEVLSKALAIVHPSTTADVEPSVGARSSASDSFDENTFYSSQHDTPEASSSSQGQKEPGEIESLVTIPRDEHPSVSHSVQGKVRDQGVVNGTSFSKDNTTLHGRSRYSPAQNLQPTKRVMEQISSASSDSSASRHIKDVGSRSKHLNQQVQAGSSTAPSLPTSHSIATPSRIDESSIVQRTTHELLQQAFDNNRTSPLIRAHNLSPLAPQPARVSPLATAREPPIMRDIHLVDEAPPAQVAALRNVASGISSTDSSPKGVKASEKRKDKDKKKEKKNKRRTMDNSITTPDSPYIKPEPRSTSPMGVAPLPRPQKKQRQSGQFAMELNYDDSRAAPSTQLPERLPERALARVKDVQDYSRYEARYEPERRRVERIYQPVARDEDGYRSVSGGQYIPRPQSPVYTVPYQPTEVRTIRAASHAGLDRRVHEEPRYYREPISQPIRIDADRERSRSPIMRERRSPIMMAPPRRPVRIVVDEFGNEYIDPTPVQLERQSMAPPIRYRDPEIIYERAPPIRAVSRAPIDTFEEDGVVYQRPAPYPRRVVTQPEYATPAPPDYRSYRQREYSMAPPMEEYVQVRAPERRHVSQYDAPIREFSRAPSARPEGVRYEVPREYTGRVQSVRPEAPREYVTSVHPDARREVAVQSQREFSARPIEIQPREQLGGQAGERYYEEAGRRPLEVTYIGRPRAREASVMVYADQGVREVYR